MTTCALPNCNRPYRARGWCSTHYARWSRTGSAQVDTKVRLSTHHLSDKERVYAQLSIDPDMHCWLWGGELSEDGYGRVRINGRKTQVHRQVYEWYLGEVPDGLSLDHLCRIRRCANPEHLEPVTVRENLLRGETLAAKNANKTHCMRGHELAGDNVRQVGGRRYCKECGRIRSREWKRKKRDLVEKYG